MCVTCDQPDLAIDVYVVQVRERLTRHRFLVVGISGALHHAESSGTVALTAYGLSEPSVPGVRSAAAHRLLHSWGGCLLDEDQVLPGAHLTCGPSAKQAVAVVRPQSLHGGVVRALQLAWTEARGRWPWEEGHRAGQPVLGEPAPWSCDEHRPDRLDVPPHR